MHDRPQQPQIISKHTPQTQTQTRQQPKGVGKGNHNPNKQKIDENIESFRNFVRRFRNSPITKEDYINWLRRYVEYSNLPQIRAKTGVDINDNTDLLIFDDPRKIQYHIKQFIDYQYDVLHLSPNTVDKYYDAIKHFYQSNEVTLNWHIIKDYLGSTSNISANLDMPYTYEEIHKMLDKADERERLIILLLCSAGIRIGALPELKYSDLKWIEQYQIYEITAYRGFKEEYITYCSLECASALNSYLDYRRRYGEKIKEDSYLIRKQFNVRNQYKGLTVKDPPQKHKLTLHNTKYILYKLVYEAGIRDTDSKKTRRGDRHKHMLSHSFRKFFENKCLEAGIDPFYVSVLMGHRSKGIGVERHYYRPTAINGENSLLELYVKKALPYLTISEESRLRLKNRELEMRMKEDEERYEKIKRDTEEIIKTKAERDAITVLADRIRELEKRFEEQDKKS